MRVLVTGGAGYIGSHVVSALLDSGHEPVVIDDLSTGDPGRLPADVRLLRADFGDPDAIRGLLGRTRVDAVFHLAACKIVDESIRQPLRYYQSNVTAWRTLLGEILRADIGIVVLASSAAIYGSAADGVVAEEVTPRPQSPYGRSKLIGEWLLSDAAAASGLSWAALRIFNVAGADRPTLADRTAHSLLPQLLSALDRGEPGLVYGDAHPTPDGTCIRDYVHVADVAEALVATLPAAAGGVNGVFNVGTGRGASVLEMIDIVERVTGRSLPHRVIEPCAGDPAWVVADIARVGSQLRWRARRDLESIVLSDWAARHAS